MGCSILEPCKPVIETVMRDVYDLEFIFYAPNLEGCTRISSTLIFDYGWPFVKEVWECGCS
jgi:hypothetical protein